MPAVGFTGIYFAESVLHAETQAGKGVLCDTDTMDSLNVDPGIIRSFLFIVQSPIHFPARGEAEIEFSLIPDQAVKYYFEQEHQSFYENLQKAYPALTYKDVRLCSFLKLGLSSKEIASITFKEVRSVESARNRLRKKMNLDADVNLIEFFARF